MTNFASGPGGFSINAGDKACARLSAVLDLDAAITWAKKDASDAALLGLQVWTGGVDARLEEALSELTSLPPACSRYLSGPSKDELRASPALASLVGQLAMLQITLHAPGGAERAAGLKYGISRVLDAPTLYKAELDLALSRCEDSLAAMGEDIQTGEAYERAMKAHFGADVDWRGFAKIRRARHERMYFAKALSSLGRPPQDHDGLFPPGANLAWAEPSDANLALLNEEAETYHGHVATLTRSINHAMDKKVNTGDVDVEPITQAFKTFFAHVPGLSGEHVIVPPPAALGDPPTLDATDFAGRVFVGTVKRKGVSRGGLLGVHSAKTHPIRQLAGAGGGGGGDLPDPVLQELTASSMHRMDVAGCLMPEMVKEVCGGEVHAAFLELVGPGGQLFLNDEQDEGQHGRPRSLSDPARKLVIDLLAYPNLVVTNRVNPDAFTVDSVGGGVSLHNHTAPSLAVRAHVMGHINALEVANPVAFADLARVYGFRATFYTGYDVDLGGDGQHRMPALDNICVWETWREALAFLRKLRGNEAGDTGYRGWSTHPRHAKIVWAIAVAERMVRVAPQ